MAGAFQMMRRSFLGVVNVQIYAILRGACFAESGFNLEFSSIAPGGLKKSMNAVITTLDTSGKPVRIERVPGCDGQGEDFVSIPLRPYANPEKACAALSVICNHLPDALAGDNEAKRVLGEAWSHVLFNTMAIESQDAKTQLAMLENGYGAGRVHDQLNRFGNVAGLGMPDPVLMVNEALNPAATVRA